MKTFSEFGITTTTTKSLAGDKVKIERILNREIEVEAYKIGPSNFVGKGPRLDLQFTLNGTRHIIFTSGTALIEAIKQVPENEFPFKATIVKEDQRLEFR